GRVVARRRAGGAGGRDRVEPVERRRHRRHVRRLRRGSADRQRHVARPDGVLHRRRVALGDRRARPAHRPGRREARRHGLPAQARAAADRPGLVADGRRHRAAPAAPLALGDHERVAATRVHLDAADHEPRRAP
ncbi:MAG: hypothetical protein AVDCRST_MAG85-1690, partial [uncultured Solirubrobacteraceae bacterium]